MHCVVGSEAVFTAIPYNMIVCNACIHTKQEYIIYIMYSEAYNLYLREIFDVIWDLNFQDTGLISMIPVYQIGSVYHMIHNNIWRITVFQEY